MLNIFKFLMLSLALGAMLTVASVAQPVNLVTEELAMLQKDKQKERERPVERDKKDERDKPRDEKKDDKRKKPDQQS